MRALTLPVRPLRALLTCPPVAALAVGLAAACGSSAAEEPAGAGGQAEVDASTADAQGGGGAGGADAGNAGDCLPAGVTALLKSRCAACHGSPLAGGAPYPIESLSDLQSPDPKVPGASVAQSSLATILGGTMPPGGGLTDAEKTAFQSWVGDGAKGISCTPVDAGGGGAGGAGGSGGADPFAAPAGCATGLVWFLGDLGNELMHPGVACIACHTSKNKGPAYTIAGTVYLNGHDNDDCGGAGSAGATIAVTDGNGQTFSIPVNFAGSFHYAGPVVSPYHVKVVSNGKERAMAAAPTSGDCNSCHTAAGTNAAPGRIVLP